MRKKLSKNSAGSEEGGFFAFFLLQLYQADAFLHLTQRIPLLGVIRFTSLLFLLIVLCTLPTISKKIQNLELPPSKTMFLILIYIVLTIPIVEWPGSVIKLHALDYLKAVSYMIFPLLIIHDVSRLKKFIMLYVFLQTFRIFEPLFIYILTGEMTSSTHVGGGEFAGRLGGSRYDIINANELGFIIITTMVYVYFLFYMNRGVLFKVLSASSLVLMMYGLLLTLSRGAMLTLVLSLLPFLKNSRNKLSILIVLCVLGVYGWANLDGFQKDRFLSLIGKSTTEANQNTVQGRIDGVLSEFSLFLDRPVVGHGVGTTSEAKANIKGSSQASHSMYAELLIELGLIGFILYMILFRQIWKVLKQSKNIVKNANSDIFIENNQILKVLPTALGLVFIMNLIYSINYFGVSQYYWYFLGGLSVILYNQIRLISGEDVDEKKQRRSINKIKK